MTQSHLASPCFFFIMIFSENTCLENELEHLFLKNIFAFRPKVIGSIKLHNKIKVKKYLSQVATWRTS